MGAVVALFDLVCEVAEVWRGSTPVCCYHVDVDFGFSVVELLEFGAGGFFVVVCFVEEGFEVGFEGVVEDFEFVVVPIEVCFGECIDGDSVDGFGEVGIGFEFFEEVEGFCDAVLAFEVGLFFGDVVVFSVAAVTVWDNP